MIKKTILPVILIATILISIGFISAEDYWGRSKPWGTDPNLQSDYADTMNKLKGDTVEPVVNNTNESGMTAEEKEALRNYNNLIIAQRTGSLTPAQEEEIEEIEYKELKQRQEENKGFGLYIFFGLIIVGFIFWMAFKDRGD